MAFGSLLKGLLDEKGMTVYQLAKETGIPKTTIYAIIKRDSNPDLFTMASLMACVSPESAWLLNEPDILPKEKDRNLLTIKNLDKAFDVLQASIEANVKKVNAYEKIFSDMAKQEKKLQGIIKQLTKEQREELITYGNFLASQNKKE